MSSNSNLGYGGINPYNNSSFVNGTSTNYSGSFSSNEVPGLPGLAGAKSNVDAAAGIVPGICNFKGGAKRLKNKIKNISKRYKMKGGKKGHRSLKRKIRSRAMGSRSLARSMALSGGRKRRRTRRVMKGGYSQYQNNQPFNIGYSVGGVDLAAKDSALATPGPIKAYNDVVDNYDHYTNKGFSSQGH